ncbi:MAG: Hsp20/alpha crystallin family protein [Desulfobacterales bacterium]
MTIFAPMTVTEETFPRNWNPSADIYEEDEHYVIKAEVPGVDKNNIHINFENNVLVLKGERTENKEVKKKAIIAGKWPPAPSSGLLPCRKALTRTPSKRITRTA